MRKLLKSIVLLIWFGINTTCGQKKSDMPKADKKTEDMTSSTSTVPNSMVRSVRQAKNGDILVASSKGVFRYNGKTFTNITSAISPSNYSDVLGNKADNIWFWDVLEDKKGNLWFATRNSGLYFYDGKNFKQFTKKDGLADDFVCSIYEDRAGKIWFATGGGISRYDAKASQLSNSQKPDKISFQNFTIKNGLPSNDITSIIEDKTGKFWIGTRGNACTYDGKTFSVFKNKDGKPFYNVWTIIQDTKGIIWLGGSIIEKQKGILEKGKALTLETGLWRQDGSTFIKVSERGASSIIQDKKGNIWTSGELKSYGDWALSRYDAKSLYNKTPSFTDMMPIKEEKMLFRFLEAKDGSIWFGFNKGVYRYDGKTITDFKRKDDQ
jgi:ligand-binding sensor domain-containing protein